MTDQPEPQAFTTATCEHDYESRLLGGHPLTVRACTLCRTPDWADLAEQAVELYRWGWQEGRSGKAARKTLSAYDKPGTADLMPGITPSVASDPLAAFRHLADRYARHAAEQDCNSDAEPVDEVRPVQWGLAAGWKSAEYLLRHTIDGLDNSRTTPDNPAASDDTRRRALAHNAVATALNAHGEWLPLSVREAVADAVLDQRLNDTLNPPRETP